MDIHDQLAAATAASAADLPGLELLPERLARASAELLPVDGAGISLFFGSDRRLPLGASGPEAAVAERLQFTIGEGPCLTAVASGEAVVADEATIRSTWPVFYDGLVAGTAVREIVSVPFEDPLERAGALNFYLVPPRDVHVVALPDARAVAREVGSALLASNRRATPEADGPAWLDAPAAGRRAVVWQAMGMVNAALGVTSPDALALLRATAFSCGQLLDDLAAQVVDHHLSLDRLSSDAGGPR